MRKWKSRRDPNGPKKDRKFLKRSLIVLLIILSYFFSYGLPLIYSYNILKADVVTRTFSWSSRGMGFLGFLAFSFILGVAFIIRLSIVLARKRGSIARVLYFGGITILFLFLGVYFINKIIDFSLLIENGAPEVLEGLRLFFKGFRAILVITMIGQGLSMLCRIIAICIDRSWVKEIDWI